MEYNLRDEEDDLYSQDRLYTYFGSLYLDVLFGPNDCLCRLCI
jgi:hypothetical protein